ncbi:MAG: hypothetical protein KIT02_14490 [Devosia sp.]|uniref:YciI family protein n=1 Tax=Devosia sp. TaxID=1871048 RepID=UPI0024CA555F|nr:hypothetical protein [Devosia sp.]UYN99121.1 MAG: hypothetical protein KIT02_14490 [Devosia sp.]
MYIILLRPAGNRAAAGQHLEGHKAWLERGLADGKFVLWDSLSAGGGAVLARGLDRAAVDQLVAGDPFVSFGVVTPEIIELAPARTRSGLEFLLETPEASAP